jgi:hypothetical protein
VDQRAALEGNGLPLEDELPNATNPYITSTKVLATPDEVSVNSFEDAGTDWVELGVAQNSDGYFVGADGDVSADISQQWFALYTAVQSTDQQYINDEFAAVVIEEIRVGSSGGVPPFTELTAGDLHIDDLGFFIPDAGAGGTLYLKLNHNISAGGARASFGRRTHLGDFPPQFMIQRGPQSGQINTNILRLLEGTPNVQFSDVAIWDNVAFGQVAAWNAAGSQFVVADPNNMKMPIGVRGTANNLIQEGMLTLVGAGFPTGVQVYADKANPGSLTTTPNEWFIGTAITDTILLVNMNGIPLQESGEVTPGVTFPAPLLANIQEGQTCAFDTGSLEWVQADPSDPNRLPTGLKGTADNVIMSGLYVPSVGNPFMPGIKQYAHPTSAGVLTSDPNNWYVGIATATNQLLVNMNSVPIPLNWSVEHDDVTGRHKFPTGGVGARPSNPAIGTIVLRTDLDQNFIEYYNGTFWQTGAEQTFASGTKMLFVQDSIPTGWTLDQSMNDRAVIITANTTEEAGPGPLAGTLNGAWVISGIEDTAVQLEADQLPIHTHLLTTAGWTDNDSGVLNNNGPGISYIDIEVGPFQTDPAAGWGVRSNRGDDGTAETLEELHQHGVDQDGTWRPYNVAVIVCTKD